jgi:ATP-binding cassette subfamily B protein
MTRFLVPETIQTSAVDCGPAALKSLLEGFGIAASYGRLREACQTGLDGTSIDTIEVVAREVASLRRAHALDEHLAPAAGAVRGAHPRLSGASYAA